MQIYTKIAQSATSLSHPLLEEACVRHWGLSPLPPISKGEWGKPYFEDSNHHFNLSHSGDIIVCCLADLPVGVDIQLPRLSRTAFLDKVCSVEERAWLRNFGDSEQAFALLWAMKESFVKYTGRGLTRPLSAITTPLPDTLPSGERWIVYPLGEVVFSLRPFHTGFISVCSTQAMTKKIIDLT